MDIIAISVSVNYADILEQIIQQNAKLLHTWIIVTSPEDAKTIQVIENAGCANVVTLLYEHFYVSGAAFNKGGAVHYAQTYIQNNFTDANILLLDSDIYLPDNFKEALPAALEKDTLYGVNQRLDYWTTEDFVNNKNPHVYPNNKGYDGFVGFFQLYKQNNAKKYEFSYNCAKCDDAFTKKFVKRVRIPITVKHLGRDKINWDGRIPHAGPRVRPMGNRLGPFMMIRGMRYARR